MHRFTTDQLVLYLSGQMRPVLIPEMPLFLTYNIALVRKGMDLSHGVPRCVGLETPSQHSGGGWGARLPPCPPRDASRLRPIGTLTLTRD